MARSSVLMGGILRELFGSRSAILLYQPAR
jgi:hypothetical protein